jgi:6-phosphofructokinase 1
VPDGPKTLAVLTSGGDAPGMNAAIRAVVRSAGHRGAAVLGVRHGYKGLLDGDFIPLGRRDVSGIIERGGTMLGSARCPDFQRPDAHARAAQRLADAGAHALVVIGGNGSQAGAHALAGRGVAVVGVGSTIDNDLYGADMTLGVDTALNVALRAVDQLKVTASSHRRASIIEVMGRDCGYLALMVGLAGGAEAIVIPEDETDPDAVGEIIRRAWERGKSHAVVVVAEGARHGAMALHAHLLARKAALGFDTRVTVLGHVQRGGTPTAFDRLLGTRLGAGAVDALLDGERSTLVAWRAGAVSRTPLADVVARRKILDRSLLALAATLE